MSCALFNQSKIALLLSLNMWMSSTLKLCFDFVAGLIAEKKYMLQVLEMSALQYQINPHFIVNTLKCIYWRCVKQSGIASSPARMIENLLDITGYCLSAPSETVTLGEEILHAKSYTDILTERHGEKMTISKSHTEDISEATCKRMIIQPFIENAYYHGIRGSNRPGKITIRIRRMNEFIVIWVIDNGVGIPPEKLQAIRGSLLQTDVPLDHIGICNPHRRLVLAFGPDYGVNISSKAGFGTIVRICVPLNFA